MFRGRCRKLIMSKVRKLDIANTENFYQKLLLQMFVRIRRLNLSGTTISSENFFTCDGCKTSQGSGDGKMREHLRGRNLPHKRLLAKPGKCKHFVQLAIRSSG